MRCIALVFALLLAAPAMSQRDRYAFAQTYFGMQGGWQGVAQADRGVITAPDFLASRVIIGGTHFWRKADFYVSFPIVSRAVSGNPVQWGYTDGVITGGRFLPLGLSRKHPTPFAGIQWVVPGFAVGEGPVVSRSRLGFDAGLGMVIGKSWTVEAAAGFILHQKYRYYTTRTVVNKVHAPELGIHVAVKKYVDFTAGMGSAPARQYVSGLREYMDNRGGLSTFSIAAGPSSTIPLSAVPFARQFQWISDRPLIAIHPDLGVGYYFHKPDLALRLAFRAVLPVHEGHGLELYYRQRHWAAEAFKFLFDYKGFVPFAGLSAGITSYKFRLRDSSEVVEQLTGRVFSYALVFGWDIRPSDVEWFILRTNLRYMPAAALRSQGLRVTAHQLEFNFIQVVIYPERVVRAHQMRREE